MRNNAFSLTLGTFVAAIFGFFLRWLQNLNGFDADGLAIPGAKIAVVFTVYSILVLLAVMLCVRICRRKADFSRKAHEALVTPNFTVKAAVWVVAGVTVIGGLVLMFGSDFSRFPTMQRLTGALCIFAGVCIPFLLRPREEKEPNPNLSLMAMVPVVFCCFWLICSYRAEAENPVVWAYAPDMLAIIAVLVSFYYLAAYFHEKKAEPGRCLITLQTAAYLCIATLMDSRSFAETLLFIAMAAAMLLFQYTILCNAEAPGFFAAKYAAEAEAKAETEAESADKPDAGEVE